MNIHFNIGHIQKAFNEDFIPWEDSREDWAKNSAHLASAQTQHGKYYSCKEMNHFSLMEI